MDTYDEKSCSALEKPYYKPIEAALRWCNLVQHEEAILKGTGNYLYPAMGVFPQWPCLRANAEKIYDAILNGEIPGGRDGRTVSVDDHVAKDKLTVRHAELKAWMARRYPDQKPAFLFDDVERTTHTAINGDSFKALQVDRDALKSRVENGIEMYKALLQDRNKIEAARSELAAVIEKMNVPSLRAETTYLNIIGGLLALMLGNTSTGKNSVYLNQEAIISGLVGNYGNAQGISNSTLDAKFADANRSIRAN